MPHPLSLHHLCALNLSAPELVRAAGAAGFDHVCLFTAEWPSNDFSFPTVTRGALERETKAALKDSGITLFDCDPFFLWPEVDVTRYRDALELAAEMGASSGTVICGDADMARAADNFGKLAEIARPLGIHIGIEFMKATTIRSIGDAVRLATQANVTEKSVVIDALHLIRTGGTVADLAALDPAMVGAIQICDGPATMPDEDQAIEAMTNRMLPGAGVFPLREIMAALPADGIVSIETPNAAEQAKYPDAAAWAKALYAAGKSIAG